MLPPAAESPASQQHSRTLTAYAHSCGIADGSELTWDALVADLPTAQRTLARSEHDRWSFLSREDHPHLQRPWYALHPCQTAPLLAMLLAPPTTTAEAESAVSEAGGGGDELGACEAATDGAELEACVGDALGNASCDGIQLEARRGGGEGGDEGGEGLQENSDGADVDAALLLAPTTTQATAEAASGASEGDGDEGGDKEGDGEDGVLLRYMLAWCSVVPAALGLTLPAYVHTSDFQRVVLEAERLPSMIRSV